jgi:carbonic anhydrase
VFDDLLAANKRYASKFHNPGVAGKAAKQLAVLTCIDSRIDPLAMLGLIPGDAKIIRNAGARATDDAIRSLVLSANLLDAKRIIVVQHTDCAMAKSSEEEIAKKVADASGADTSGVHFHAMTDQRAALAEDVAKLRAHPLIPDATEIAGFIYDVTTGELTPVDV